MSNEGRFSGTGHRAPFPSWPYFGGKRDVAAEVWARFGSPKHYIEPFCGSLAVLLSAPTPASLEVVGDANGFIANFWRATVAQPDEVARWADYPVSHLDLGARHAWLMTQRERLAELLQDPHSPGDAQCAGWWLWGQCCWIGSGWCEWDGKVPHVGDAGRGVQAIGQVPHVGNAGMGVQAIGRIPHLSDAGMWTSGGRTALAWLRRIADRMGRVRVVHGSWERCLNNHYGGDDTAVFLDPPYEGFADLYGAAGQRTVAQEAAEWCSDPENARLRVALCGHRQDYDLPGWSVYEWSRSRNTYSGTGTKDSECIWFSPSCLKPSAQASLFESAEEATPCA